MGATTRRRGWAVGAPICLVASMLATTLPFAAPASAAPSKVVHVQLRSRRIFTRSGVVLNVGDSVTVTTSGRIVFGGGLRNQMAPDGIAWGKACDAIFEGEVARNRPWPARGLRCWSMIAKVGTGPVFEIGTGKTFRATDAGRLLLGVNDNFIRDNQGHWSATVTVTPSGAAGPTPATKHSSNSTRFLLIGGLLIVVILLIVLLIVSLVVARRRRDEDEEPAPAPPVLVGAPAAAALPIPPPVVPRPAEPSPMSIGPTAAAPLPESIDVNIFEVEFSNGLTLRVGYNHFPEGTDLRWKVTQNRIPVATGRFVAKGGGSTNHVETVPLGIKLEGRDAQPDGADVQFDWTINDVPFRYSVRRDPNC